MAWPPDLITVVVTLQAIGATFVFFLLGSYNPKHRRRFEEAREVFGKKNASLFELPAFRESGRDSRNPFENTTWLLTPYERAKLSLLAVTLFLPRLLGVIVTLGCTLAVTATLLKLGKNAKAKQAVAFGCRSLLFFFGFHHVKVTGQKAEGVGALVSNHCSFVDGAAWVAVAAPRIFAEESNFKHPAMRVFAKALQIVCFDRSGSDSRRMAREKMASAAREAVEGTAPPILVFPEGTTKNLKTVITFKDGAFAPGLPVQPAVLHYRFRHCDPTWVFAGPGLPMLSFRLLCQFSNTLEVEFLPVISPTEEEKREPHKFARRVQVQVAAAMGVPMTEHTVEDVQLELAAVKAKLPAEVGVLGFSALKEVFSVDAKHIKQQMLVFRELDRSGSGKINFDDFADGFKRAFHTPSDAQAELLSKFFRELTGGQETLDFRKFLIGLALVNETSGGERPDSPSGNVATLPPKPEEFVDKYKGRMYTHLAFAAFAAGSDNCITWSEFEELWSWLHPAGILPGETVGAAAGTGSVDADKTSELQMGRRPSAAEEVSSSAREVFERIGGSGTQELPFAKFISYSEEHPEFEKQLRHAFFGRISSVLAPS